MANLIVTNPSSGTTYDTGIDISKINNIPNLEKVANETYRIQGLGTETLMRQMVNSTVNNALSDPITFQKNTLKNYTKNLVSLQNWRDIAPPPDRQTLIDGSKASINYLVNNKVSSDEINSLVNSSVKEFVDFENYKNQQIADLNKTTGFGGVPNPLANPLQTAALAAAYASGQTYLIPYINAAFALDAGQSPEKALQNAAVSYAATQAGGAVGAETGSSFAGNVAGGTTAGLLSGKPLEESLQGGVTNAAISQVTPSTLLSSSGTTQTTATEDYVPELNIGQGTPSSTSDFYAPTTDIVPKDVGTQGQAQGLLTGQGTTGATNMAQEDFTYGYGGEGYEYGGVGSTPSPPDFTYGYGDLGYEGTGSAPYTQAQIDALIPQTYTSALGTPSTLDAGLQAYLRRALAAGGSAAQSARNYLSSMGGGMNSNLLQGGLGTVAQLRQQETDRQAAIDSQRKIEEATRVGVAGSQFRPVGTTTRFGTSQFQTDPITGQIISAGYTAAPEITSAQNRLMGLGASYLAQSPEEVAQQYISKQYDLLDPSRQRQLAGIRNQQFQTGRGGLSVGSTGLRPSGAQGLMGSNPELEAYYNALAQQDAQLAAQAQQAGQQQVTFGTGLFGQAGQLENMAQQPFTLSQGLAEKSSIGGYRAGDLGYRGAAASGAIGRSPAATTNPYATVLGGFADPRSLLAQGLGSYFGSSAPSNVGGTGSVFNTGYYDPMQQQF